MFNNWSVDFHPVFLQRGLAMGWDTDLPTLGTHRLWHQQGFKEQKPESREVHSGAPRDRGARLTLRSFAET